MSEERPIIVIKKKATHAAHHGGAWKVAYADFVTAMMAFFLVMWMLGLSQNQRAAIAAYFQDPSGMMKSHAGGKNPMGIGRDSVDGKPRILPSLTSLLSENGEAARFRMAKKALEHLVKSMPEFKKFRNYIEITITAEGLRIELLEAQESLFFETGSAKLKPETVHLLQMVGKEVSTLPNEIKLEGHTDARPYSGGNTGYSNWELSTDRANSARRAMIASLRPNQVTEVRGYADRQLRNPDDPLHYSNRRISIMVAFSHKPEFRDTVNVKPNESSNIQEHLDNQPPQ